MKHLATIAALLEEDDGYFRILHEARISGSSKVERSFTYRVCGAEVTFFAPAPYRTPQCK